MRDVLFLSDLDHCLFQSKRVEPNGKHPMTVKADGTPHCFATDAQATLFSMIANRAMCVAVTARTPDQMQRAIGWKPDHPHQLALVNHGATLLYREDTEYDWREIKAWSEIYVTQAREGEQALLADVDALKKGLAHLPLPVGSHMAVSVNTLADNVPFYFNLQLKDARHYGTEETMRRIRESREMSWIVENLEHRYVHHLNDTTMGFWPAYVGKRGAVTRLVEALRDGLDDVDFERARAQIPLVALTLTAGDSHSDLPFMLEGDFMLTPTHSPIARGAQQTCARELDPFS
ncbi:MULTISPECIES: hypothetical protein [Pseudomonas]|uniref:hypothetical protein n=1 Tax=Pseudomonas TaxID=286 RepID=UPI000F02F00E|nr:MULTISPECIES: hypothetical protein [Pseudomonas]MBD8614817.1 hypothetical protein [Pseudomonas putida]MBD8681499.1 hypothetical protein [Pseudomonas sp. CFBP 13719]